MKWTQIILFITSYFWTFGLLTDPFCNLRLQIWLRECFLKSFGNRISIPNLLAFLDEPSYNSIIIFYSLAKEQYRLCISETRVRREMDECENTYEARMHEARKLGPKESLKQICRSVWNLLAFYRKIFNNNVMLWAYDSQVSGFEYFE